MMQTPQALYDYVVETWELVSARLVFLSDPRMKGITTTECQGLILMVPIHSWSLFEWCMAVFGSYAITPPCGGSALIFMGPLEFQWYWRYWFISCLGLSVLDR